MKVRRYLSSPSFHDTGPGSLSTTANFTLLEQNPWQNSNLPQRFPGVSFTTNCFPATPEVAETAEIPLGIIITPGEMPPPPKLDRRDRDMVRCRCGIYFCEYTPIVPKDGKLFLHCPVCDADVEPRVQIDPIDTDANEIYPIVDLLTPDRFRSLPNACESYVFILDLSVPAYTNGITPNFINSLNSILPNSLSDTAIVYLMTISDRVSVFDFEDSSEIIVEDSNVRQVHVDAVEYGVCKDQFHAALRSFLSYTPKSPHHCLGDACTLLGSITSGIGGYIISAIWNPPLCGRHICTPRKITENTTEFDLMTGGESFRRIGFYLNKRNLTMTLFVGSDRSPEAAYLSALTGLTGGALYLYPKFNPAQFHTDLHHVMSQTRCWDSSLRIRASDGIVLKRISGNCTVEKKGQIIVAPIMSADQSVSIVLKVQKELKHDAFFQVALLFTNHENERIIRVCSITIPVSKHYDDVRAAVNPLACHAMLVKMVSVNTLYKGVPDGLQFFNTQRIKTGSVGRRLPNSPLLAPSHPQGADGRIALCLKLRGYRVNQTVLWAYPRLFAAHPEVGVVGPLPLEESRYSFYLMHRSEDILVWVHADVDEPTMTAVFGGVAIPTELPKIDTPINVSIWAVITQSMEMCGCFLPIHIIPQPIASHDISEMPHFVVL